MDICRYPPAEKGLIWTSPKPTSARLAGQSEKMGLRLETARIHYLLGRILELGGNSGEASAQHARARNILDEIKKEPGAEHLAERFDLREMFAARAGATASGFHLHPTKRFARS